MAVVISSVTAAPGYFPQAALTITGTGFGASPGDVFIVWPSKGEVFEFDLDGASWAATSITGLSLPALVPGPASVSQVPSDHLDETFYIVVVASGTSVGGRSAGHTFVASTVANTVLADWTLVSGYSVSSGAPNCEPFGGPVGFVNGFDNPGYTVQWYSAPDVNGIFTSYVSTNSETGIAPLGASVQAAIAFFGYTFDFTV